MNVTPVDGITRNIRGANLGTQEIVRTGLNHPTTTEPLPVVPTPRNDNPGIVPPWLQNDNGGIVPPWLRDEFHILPWPLPVLPTDPVIDVNLVGIAPDDPDAPHIM